MERIFKNVSGRIKKLHQIKKKVSLLYIVINFIIVTIVIMVIILGRKPGFSLKAEKKIKDITERVGKLVDLPEGEDPTAATVSDVGKLSGQAFFRDAQNGDQVLIYQKAGRAILYRPLTNKVINMAPIGGATGYNSDNPKPTPIKIVTLKDTTLALYSISNSQVTLDSTAQTIRARYPGVQILTKEGSRKKDYQKIQVVDVVGNKTDEVQALAALLGGQVGVLSSDELRPAADILIVVQ